MKKITYFDFSDLVYASFFLYGFFRHSKLTGEYLFEISKSPPNLAIQAVNDNEGQNLLFSILLFKVTGDGEDYYFCIDTRDSNSPLEAKGLGYHLPLLESVRYYFKANYNQTVIDLSPVLQRQSFKILPTVAFFPVALPEWYRMLPRLRKSSPMGWDTWCVKHRLKRMPFQISLQNLRALRSTKKEVDIFYVAYCHGSGTSEQLDEYDIVNDFRYQLINEIRTRKNITSIAGFVGNGEMPVHYKKYQLQSRPYRLPQYLFELSKSRVSIYVRGIHDCLSFKFGQLLCMGMPVCGQHIANNADWYYSLPNFKEQFAYETPKELVDQAEYILSSTEALDRLSESNANIFELFFSPEVVVKEMLSKLDIFV